MINAPITLEYKLGAARDLTIAHCITQSRERVKALRDMPNTVWNRVEPEIRRYLRGFMDRAEAHLNNGRVGVERHAVRPFDDLDVTLDFSVTVHA